MKKSKRAKITGPIAAVIIAAIAGTAAILIFAPEDVRSALLAVSGPVTTILAAYLRSPRDVAVGE